MYAAGQDHDLMLRESDKAPPISLGHELIRHQTRDDKACRCSRDRPGRVRKLSASRPPIGHLEDQGTWSIPCD